MGIIRRRTAHVEDENNFWRPTYVKAAAAAAKSMRASTLIDFVAVFIFIIVIIVLLVSLFQSNKNEIRYRSWGFG
jgi:hypothetical protein